MNRNKLKRWRLARGLTVRELAKAAAVSPSFVYKVEAGQKLPSLEVALKLAQALQVPVEQIFVRSS